MIIIYNEYKIIKKNDDEKFYHRSKIKTKSKIMRIFLILLLSIALAQAQEIAHKNSSQNDFIDFKQDLYPTSNTQILSIEKAIELANTNYPLHQNKKLIDEALSLTLTQLNMNYIPHLSLAGKASYQSDVTRLPSQISQISNFKGLRQDQYQTYIELSQPIYDSGSTSANKKLSIAQHAHDQASLENTLYKVKESVINTYFNALLAKEQNEQIKIHIQELEKNLQSTQAKYKNGIALQSDIDKINIEILKAQKDSQYFYSQMLIALHTLKELSGIQNDFILQNPELPSDVPRYIEELTQIHIPKEEKNPQNAKKFSEELILKIDKNIFNMRPELRYFESKSQIINAQRQIENTKNLPYLELYAQGGYANPALNILEDEFKTYYIVGMRVKWDFSNLYSKRQQDEIYRKQNLQVKASQEEFLLNERIKLISQIKSISTLHIQLKQSEDIITLQEKIIKSLQARYENGTLSADDLLTDTNKLNSLKLEYNYQKIELIMQIYKIKQLINLF